MEICAKLGAADCSENEGISDCARSLLAAPSCEAIPVKRIQSSMRTCLDCPTEITARNKSGRCRPCSTKRNNTDPEIVARRNDAIRRRFADPAIRAEHARRVAEWNRNLPDSVRQSRRAHGLKKAAKLKAAAAAITAETRAENGRKRSDTTLAWCPPEWRDRYREIKIRGKRAAEAKRIVLDLIAGKPEPTKYARQKAVLAWCPVERRAEYERFRHACGAAEAKRMVLEEMAATEARRLASLTPLQRQIERVQAGASLVAKPSFARADHTFTLGGVASGML